MTQDEAKFLLEYATTQTQKDMLALIVDGKAQTPSVAGRMVGVSGRAGRSTITSLKASLAERGIVHSLGMNGETVPEGMYLDGMTVYTNKDGSVTGRWDKAKKDKADAQKAVMEAIHAACEGLPQAPRVAKPKGKSDNLLSLYTVSDLHIGLLSWKRETGEAYDTNEARKVLWTCFCDMMDRMPDTDHAIICNLGDFIHYDGLISQTAQNKNPLDTDSRYQKLAEVALGVQTWMVEKALQKHKEVKLINAEGNHDEAGSAWLRVAMAYLYRNNPRVTVDDSPAPYYAHLHGQTMLAWHHGHKRADKDLGALFSADHDFRAMWGKAKRTYIHTGHRHSQSVTELPGAVVERHPTLAARSSYEARGGWQSYRAAKAICYDAEGNERMRITVTPDTKDD